MIGLQERIETARDASSKVAEQDRVREQARELPRLLAEREHVCRGIDSSEPVIQGLDLVVIGDDDAQ